MPCESTIETQASKILSPQRLGPHHQLRPTVGFGSIGCRVFGLRPLVFWRHLSYLYYFPVIKVLSGFLTIFTWNPYVAGHLV